MKERAAIMNASRNSEASVRNELLMQVNVRGLARIPQLNLRALERGANLE